MADVFISYAREDVGTAERFAHVLEARGWSVWWDRDLVAGREFDRVIETELQAARAVVVIWSPHSVQSRWVKSEASLAIDRGTMVPVLFGGVQAPFQFRTIHAVEFGELDGEPAGQAIDWVFTAIAQLCEAPTTGSVPLPPPPPPRPSPPPAREPSPAPEEPLVGGDEASTRPRRWRRVVWGAVAVALVAAGLAGLASVRAVLDDHGGSTATTSGTTTTSTTTAAPTTTASPALILHLGSTGGDVKELQRLLQRAGYRPGSVDGTFGKLTLGAVQGFERQHRGETGVSEDGTIQVDGREWALLASDVSHGNGGTSPPTTSSPPPTGPFQVIWIDISTSPPSIDGEVCGTTVEYTVTFHLAPNGPGGVIAFSYSFSNGRGDERGQVTVPPGHTVASTTLPRSEPDIGDSTSYPPLIVLVDSPNSPEPSQGGPTGQCVGPIPST